MFLTSEQTGSPQVYSLRRHNFYLAVDRYPDGQRIQEFDVRQLAQVLGQDAGETWQEHASVIQLACMDGRLFEWLDKTGGIKC